MGPLILDLVGLHLLPEEKEMLEHPLTSGLILFSRNFSDIQQLKDLVEEIRRSINKPLLISVDHEGGRVQRFREGFTQIPAMGSIIHAAENSVLQAKHFAEDLAWLMASELREIGIDLSFAPVLDINGCSKVIGDRGFSANQNQIVELSSAFIDGMAKAGMKSTGKHFPGHGNVEADSHFDLPIDSRDAHEIFQTDMYVFKQVMQQSSLDAVMPAHVIYEQVDALPAGFSEVWLKDILRKQLGFNGIIFSDDLSMAGAAHYGDHVTRAKMALNAGVDLLLVCNDQAGAISVLDNLDSNIRARHDVDFMLISI